MLLSNLRQRFRSARAHLFRPHSPGSGLELLAQHGVVGVIDQPSRLRLAKCFEFHPLLSEDRILGRTIEKILRRLNQQRELTCFHFIEIDVALTTGQPRNAR
jgi:hypothetical protein